MLQYYDLPLSFDQEFGLWEYSNDASLVLLRHRGPYPQREDDSFVPTVIDVMFDRVRALALRNWYKRLDIREADTEEYEALKGWIDPKPWRSSKAYVLGDGISNGWVIANHVYYSVSTMEWHSPSTLLTDLPEGRIVGAVYRNR